MLCRMISAVVAYRLLAVDDFLLDEDFMSAGSEFLELDVASAHFWLEGRRLCAGRTVSTKGEG